MSTYANAYAKVLKWISDFQFPGNGFQFDIIWNDFWSSIIFSDSDSSIIHGIQFPEFNLTTCMDPFYPGVKISYRPFRLYIVQFENT